MKKLTENEMNEIKAIHAKYIKNEYPIFTDNQWSKFVKLRTQYLESIPKSFIETLSLINSISIVCRSNDNYIEMDTSEFDISEHTITFETKVNEKILSHRCYTCRYEVKFETEVAKKKVAKKKTKKISKKD